MSIVNKLTLRHLRRNKGRTLITVLGVMLSVAMVCAVAGFVMSAREVMRDTIVESKGDWHVAFQGVTPEAAADIAGKALFATSYTETSETAGLINLYLRLVKPGRDYWELCLEAAVPHGYEAMRANRELLALEGAIAQDQVLTTFIIVGAIAVAIIVAGSVVVIANAFYISASERVRQFGLLKSVGATKSQIGRSILFEAFLLTLVAMPLGVLLGFAIQSVVLRLVNMLLADLNSMNDLHVTFRVVFYPVILYITAAVTALTMLISAWMPARRAAKTSPIDAIRQTKDIQIRAGRLKTSRLTKLLFGFEGTLAAKTLKRNRGKYRATVLSLIVSIVLYVGISSFVAMLNKGTAMEYGGYDFDVLVSAEGDPDSMDEAQRLLESLPDVSLRRRSILYLEAEAPEGFVTEKATADVTAEGLYPLVLSAVADERFAELASAEPGTTGGILVNTTGSYAKDGKLREDIPYACEQGAVLNFAGGSVSVTAVIEEIPKDIPASLFAGTLINVIVPDTVFRTLYQSVKTDTRSTAFAVKVKDSEAFGAAAAELLTSAGVNAFVTDVSRMTRMNQNIILIVSLFGYGFIAMLSLIAVTSVVATISTGMALRRQEFAMLHSVGMTVGGMNRMLNLESLLYGLKSLLIGLPLGVLVSYLIYLGMRNMAVFPYEAPWFSITVSAAAVFALTFCTMRYGRRKFHRMSIVEAIRSEAV